MSRKEGGGSEGEFWRLEKEKEIESVPHAFWPFLALFLTLPRAAQHSGSETMDVTASLPT